MTKLILTPTKSLFDDLFAWNPRGGQTVWSAVPVHATSDAEHVYVTADLPGVAPEDVDLTYDKGVLSITGKRGERLYRYAVTVGNEVDPERITAALDKGVLTITADKRPEAKPRKIALGPTMAQRSIDVGGAAE